jgi:hypothetical protein
MFVLSIHEDTVFIILCLLTFNSHKFLFNLRRVWSVRRIRFQASRQCLRR